MAELWRARELAWTLAERDLRARYKQTFLGFSWAVITPVLLMVVFNVFFKRVARIDTDPVPYALFSYVGLLPWTFFSSSVSGAGMSLTANMSLLNKVYFPREVVPIATTLVAAVDMGIATAILGFLFAIYTFAPKAESIWVPVILIVQLAFTLGIGLIVSVVNVYVRDLRQGLSMILQLGLFATPVVYGIEEIPKALRPLYAVVNPLAPVIDAYRRTVLMGQAPRLGLLLLGAVSSAAVLLGGYALFKRLETGIADVA